MSRRYSVGVVTAYGAAKAGGYTGTYSQFCEDLADLGDNIAEVREARIEVDANKTAAQQAQEGAETAQGAAEDAAESVSQSAAQIEQNRQDIDDLKSATKDIEARTLSDIKHQTTINTTVSQSIVASNHVFDVTIPAGTPYTLRVNDTDSTIGKFALYANGSAIKTGCDANTDYVFTPSAEVTWLSMYCNTVAQTGAIEVVLTVDNLQPNLEDTVAAHGVTIANYRNEFEKIPEGLNLFDKTAITTGKNVNASTGALVNGYNATDFIPVRSGVRYYVAIIEKNRCALYDSDQKYLSPVTAIDSDITNIWYFEPEQDGFFRGSLLSLTVLDGAFLSSYGTHYYTFKPKTDYSLSSEIAENDISIRAVGVVSGNLFTGGSTYTEIVASTYAEKYEKGHNIITTPMIPISGNLFWLFARDVQGCVQYVTQYDANGDPIAKTQLSGKPLGFVALNASTRSIRLSTASMSSWADKLTTEQFDSWLYVTDDIHKLQKNLSVDKITDRHTTSWDFYNRSAIIKHDYVETAIQAYKDQIQKTGYDFVMPINTDLHTLDAESYNMLKLMAESGVANVCFNLGDNLGWILGKGEDTAFGELSAFREWSNSPMAKCPLLILRGNHDNNPTDGHLTDPEYTVSNAQFYNAMQERTIPGYAGVNKSYGYLDFEQPKIRVIFLDGGDIYDDNGDPLTSAFNVTIRQEQLSWFCNTALNFMDKADRAEWSVITCAHCQLKQLAESAFNAIIKAFLDGSTANGTQTKTYSDTGKSETLSYSVDFTAQGAMEYICHVNGHNHYDYAFKMGTTDRYDIDICADTQSERGVYDGTTVTPYTWTPGTIEERCMDTLCLDKANRRIIMKRLGVGASQMTDGQRVFGY